MLREELQIPSRDTLVAAAIRQMARDLRAHENERRANADEVIERTTVWLRNRLGRCPTPAEVARTGGIDVEDVLDEISRRTTRPAGVPSLSAAAGIRAASTLWVPAVSSLPASSRPSGAELLRTIAAGTASATGTAFLRSLVQHVAEALDAEIAFAAEVDEGAWARRPGARRARPRGRGARRGLRLLDRRHAVRAGERPRRRRDPQRHRGRLPARRLRRPPRARRLPGDRRPRQRRGADRLPRRDVRARARRRRGGDRGPADLRRARRAPRSSAAATRPRCAPARREVAASRARLVSVADEERRRIGRNLHDGAQQRMIVLGHRIELARRKLEQDPEQAAEHLRHASDEARAAGAELRELARGLHPAGLAEYGLEPTLAALAGRSPLALEVTALPDRRLPEVVEVSIYYLVSEALSNAVKYADANARAGRGRAGRRPRARGGRRRRRRRRRPGGGLRPRRPGGPDRGARRHARGRLARRRGDARCARGSRSRPGARRASRSWSSATPTTAAPARS